MAPDKNRVVFVGNIPYGMSERAQHVQLIKGQADYRPGTSEDILTEILGRVGHVLNFRLVHDKDTGKPKGFGFAEYADPDSAASAVRNLNEHELMGRKLRVDWSNDGGGAPSNQNQNNAPAVDMQSAMNGQPPPSLLPELPAGADLPPNITTPDAISKTLRALPPPQLLDMISQMKGLVMSDPAQATLLFQQAPQLAYAMFQALLLLGLVDTNILSSILEQQATAPAPPAVAPAPAAPPPVAQPPMPQPYAQPPQPAYAQQYGQQQYAPTPPTMGQYQPPAPQPVQQAAPPMTGDPNRDALIRQVLSMPQSQIDALPAQQRDQVIMLKQQLMAGQMPF